jgi:hypothetical protein
MTKAAFKIDFVMKFSCFSMTPQEVAKRADETWEAMFPGRRGVWTDDSLFVQDIVKENDRLTAIVESINKSTANEAATAKPRAHKRGR